MFPFSSQVVLPALGSLRPELILHYQSVLEHVAPLLTSDRIEKIKQVVSLRCFDVAVVLENIYDSGNANAVMRSAEAMGFGNIHSIEPGVKHKTSQRITKGADKWLEVQRWKSTLECVQQLKKEGKKIVVTCLENSVPLQQVDFSVPCALVLGNEKDGASQEMISLADERVVIPMQGFVQSYNISVAGALCLYHIFMERQTKLGKSADLNELQQQILMAHYYLRSQPSSEDYIRELVDRGQVLATP
jgi:tRNA (guanosine-2'-O-)-methyltransferase